PPSERADGEYRWLNDHPIADAPPWLLDLVTAPAPRRPNGKGPVDGIVIADALKDLPVERLGANIEPQTASIGEIAAALAVIPNNDLDWDEWNKVGMAVYAASDGSDEGFALFDQWSKK